MNAPLDFQCKEDDLSFLIPGRVSNVKHTDGAHGSGNKKKKCKCSVNRCRNQKNRREFMVKIIGGNTMEDHRRLQKSLQVAMKVIESEGKEPSSIASFFDSAESESELKHEEDQVQVQLLLGDLSAYKLPIQIHFRIDISDQEMQREAPINPQTGTTTPHKWVLVPLLSENKMFDAVQVNAWISPNIVLDGSTTITARLYSIKTKQDENGNIVPVARQQGSLTANGSSTQRLDLVVSYPEPILFQLDVKSNKAIPFTMGGYYTPKYK